MHNVLFSIGNVTVYAYGLCIGIGIVLAFLAACFKAKRYGLDSDTMMNAGLIGVLFGFVGAKLLYWITEIEHIIENPRILLDIGGGFVVYGGLITGLLAAFIYLYKIKKVSFLSYIDCAIFAIPLAQAFGRIGCFMAGCCYGAPCDPSAWYGVVFPAGSLAPGGVPLYPTQLFSAAGDLCIFLILLLLSNRAKFRGQLICIYMILYSVGRFLIEFIRNDFRGEIGPFSTSQFISLFIFTAGVALWILFAIKKYPPLRRIQKEKNI